MGLFGPPDEDIDYEQTLLEKHILTIGLHVKLHCLVWN